MGRRFRNRILGAGITAAALVLLVAFGCAFVTPGGTVSDASGSAFSILCAFLALPFFWLFGYASYAVPLLLGAVGLAYVWGLHSSRRGRWIVRGALSVPLLSVLLGAVDWISGVETTLGGEAGRFLYTYLSRFLGGVLALPLGLAAAALVLVSIWGSPPWTWKRGKKRSTSAKGIGQWFFGLFARLASRFCKVKEPGAARRRAAPGNGGADRDWTPPVDGAWTARLLPDRKKEAQGEADAGEADFLPLPAPASDVPLDPAILPPPPPEDPGLSSLDASLSELQAEIIEVVQETTRVKLVPTDTPPVRGLSFARFEFGKEEGNPVPVTKIERSLKDLGLRTRRAPVRVELADAVRIELPLKGSERSFAPIKPLLEETAPDRGDAPLTYLIGRRHDGTPFELDMEEARHMLVGGATGGGKTVLLHSLLFGLAFRYPPSRVRLALFDPKMLEFARYRGLPHLWQDVATTPEGFHRLVENLHLELQRRKRARVEDPGARFPALVGVVDEFSGYNTDKLVRLVAEARALNMFFVLATQHPTADVISTSIKANLVTGVAFRVKAPTGSHLIIGTGDAVRLMGKGDCLVQAPGGLERVQAGWVRDEDFEALRIFLAKEDDEGGTRVPDGR